MKQQLNIAFQYSGSKDAFLRQVAEALQKKHPEHSIKLIGDVKHTIIESVQLHYEYMKPSLTNELARKYWYTVKLPKWLRKNECDIFFSADYRTPVASASKNIIRLSHPLRCSMKQLLPHLKRAEKVMIHHPMLEKEILAAFPKLGDKLVVIPQGLSTCSAPIDIDMKYTLMDQLTGGHEFFICLPENQSNENVLMLLKAFSIFKKWQHSQMKMLLVLENPSKKSLQTKLESYKYRKDVILLKEESLTNNVLAASYACLTDHRTDKLSQCMSASIPVIMAEDSYTESDYGNAVVFAPWNEKNISQQLILLYKDESYRSEIISNARQLLESRSWPLIATKIWDDLLLPSLA